MLINRNLQTVIWWKSHDSSRVWGKSQLVLISTFYNTCWFILKFRGKKNTLFLKLKINLYTIHKLFYTKGNSCVLLVHTLSYFVTKWGMSGILKHVGKVRQLTTVNVLRANLDWHLLNVQLISLISLKCSFFECCYD